MTAAQDEQPPALEDGDLLAYLLGRYDRLTAAYEDAVRDLATRDLTPQQRATYAHTLAAARQAAALVRTVQADRQETPDG